MQIKFIIAQSIELCKPQQNAFIESFNGSLRDEFLNEEIFDTLDEARRKLASWRYDDNNVRPYSSLQNQTPAEARLLVIKWVLEQKISPSPDALDTNSQTEDKTVRPSL